MSERNNSNISFLTKFFLFCSGANLNLISRKECDGDRITYAALGSIVTITSIMAAISGGYAIFSIFNSIAASTLFGSFWGFTIFSTDRFFILSSKKTKNSSPIKQIATLIPRLTLAGMLGLVISKPLEVKIFEPEIRRYIAEERAARSGNIVTESKNNRDVERLVVENDRLNQQKESLRQEWLEAEKLAEQEKNGLGPSGVEGIGPSYEAAREKAETLKAEMNTVQAQIDRNQQRIEQLQVKLDESVNNIQQEEGIGLIQKLVAMEELATANPNLKKLLTFITLLFVTIEVSPSLAKSLMKYSTYDALVEKETQMAIARYNREQQEFQKDLSNLQAIRHKIREKVGENLEGFISQQFASVLTETIQDSRFQEMRDRIVDSVAKISEQELMGSLGDLKPDMEQYSDTLKEFQDKYGEQKLEEVMEHEELNSKFEQMQGQVKDLEDYWQDSSNKAA